LLSTTLTVLEALSVFVPNSLFFQHGFHRGTEVARSMALLYPSGGDGG
jgi:hypothetical protein